MDVLVFSLGGVSDEKPKYLNLDILLPTRDWIQRRLATITEVALSYSLA